MTETGQPNPALPPGGYALAMLVREFARAALRQPAVAAFVREHFFNPTAEPPVGIGDALRLAVLDTLGATTSGDWDQLASYLLAYARDCLEDNGSAVAFAAPVRVRWTPPRGFFSRSFRPRKPPVRVERSDILAWLIERRSATTREIAQHFNLSYSSARLHADALVHQGKAEVTPGEPPSRPRVYNVPRPTDPPAASLGGELPAAPGGDPTGSTCPSSRIELDVFTPTNKPESRSRE